MNIERGLWDMWPIRQEEELKKKNREKLRGEREGYWGSSTRA